MSNAKRDYWANCVRMVANYPKWKAEYEELKSQLVATGIEGMPHGSGASRATENIALRELPPQKQRELEAVTRALQITQLLPTGDQQIELIRRVYWQGRKLRIEDVYHQLYVSYKTAERWHTAFIKLVGQCVGYEF